MALWAIWQLTDWAVQARMVYGRTLPIARQYMFYLLLSMDKNSYGLTTSTNYFTNQ